jgi:hypothetical protein
LLCFPKVTHSNPKRGINPQLYTLVTRDDADIFDVVSDTPLVHLARTLGVPEGRSVVHTTRNYHDWEKSYLYHFRRLLGVTKGKFPDIKDRFLSLSEFRYGAMWKDIHTVLYFQFDSLREAYDYHHDWVRSLANKGTPVLELPLELPNEVKAKLITRFIGQSDTMVPYPESNKANRLG